MQTQKSFDDLGFLATKSGFGPWLVPNEKTKIIDSLSLKTSIDNKVTDRYVINRQYYRLDYDSSHVKQFNVFKINEKSIKVSTIRTIPEVKHFSIVSSCCSQALIHDFGKFREAGPFGSMQSPMHI